LEGITVVMLQFDVRSKCRDATLTGMRAVG